MATIANLREWGFRTVQALAHLGDRTIVLSFWLHDTINETRLFPLPSEERLRRMNDNLRGVRTRFARRHRAILALSIRNLNPSRITANIAELIVEIPARAIPHMLRDPLLTSARILHIPGRRKVQLRQPHHLAWHAVMARVTIQKEDTTKGRLDAFDRIYLIQARNEKDAAKRIQPILRFNSLPYLNARGEMVRWLHKGPVDADCEVIGPLNPRGTEILSTPFRRIGLKPEYIWHPRREILRRNRHRKRKGK